MRSTALRGAPAEGSIERHHSAAKDDTHHPISLGSRKVRAQLAAGAMSQQRGGCAIVRNCLSAEMGLIGSGLA